MKNHFRWLKKLCKKITVLSHLYQLCLILQKFIIKYLACKKINLTNNRNNKILSFNRKIILQCLCIANLPSIFISHLGATTEKGWYVWWPTN